ncbi:MAG TPA: hypothetical protein VJX74_19655, partial [Blastocatellia bacterium]|nr:hypothetical protein [Blastocatellia bacterium]
NRSYAIIRQRWHDHCNCVKSYPCGHLRVSLLYQKPAWNRVVENPVAIYQMAAFLSDVGSEWNETRQEDRLRGELGDGKKYTLKSQNQ